MPRRDLYESLGLDASASAEEIKRAYRRLARELHPDLTGGDAAKAARFREVSEAYEVLSDPGRRASYDALRQRRPRPEPPRPEPRSTHRGPGPTARPRPTMRGRIELTLEEAILSAEKVFTLDLPDGSEREITLHVPPGIGDGELLRLGDVGPGELVLEVRVLPHPRFRRRGLDLELDLPVPFERAILGGPVEIPTPDGVRREVLPPGTSSGHRFHLPGQGASDRSGQRGDLHATVMITVPREPDEELRRFAERRAGEAPPPEERPEKEG